MMMFSYWDKADQSPIAGFLAEWRFHFPDFQILEDRHIEALIREHFPKHLEIYRSIQIPTCKSDIAILLGLYAFGGLFVDCHCGIRDVGAVKELLARIPEFEVILYDANRDTDRRSL